MAYLLDTNTISYAIGERDEVLDRLARLDSSIDLFSSAISEGELLYGALRSPEPKRASLLQKITMTLANMGGVALVTSEVARVYAEIRTDLEARGQPIPDNDTWIAAVAMANGYTLVSHDGAFTRIPGLKLEDWLA